MIARFLMNSILLSFYGAFGQEVTTASGTAKVVGLNLVLAIFSKLIIPFHKIFVSLCFVSLMPHHGLNRPKGNFH